MDAATVAALSDGRIYSAADALQLGLIDAVEAFDNALANLTQSALARREQMSNTHPTIITTPQPAAPAAHQQVPVQAAAPGVPAQSERARLARVRLDPGLALAVAPVVEGLLLAPLRPR